AAEQALRLCATSTFFWREQFPSEGRRWFQASLMAAPDAATDLRQKVLSALGYMAVEQGDNLPALAFFEQALVLARSLDDAWAIGEALRGVGNVAIWQGQYARAEAVYEECVALTRAADDQPGVFWSLW